MEFFNTFPHTHLRGKNRGLDWVMQKIGEFQKTIDKIPEVVNDVISDAISKGEIDVVVNVETDSTLSIPGVPADAKAAGDAVKGITASSLGAVDIRKRGTSIANDTDLNDIMTEGDYYVASNSAAATLVNSPINIGFKMLVMHTHTGTGLIQLVIPSTSQASFYFRSYTSSWSDWRRIYDTSFKPTAEEVGARAADWMPTAAEVGARAADWMPTAEEVGARAADWMPTAADVGARAADWMPNAYEVGGVWGYTYTINPSSTLRLAFPGIHFFVGRLGGSCSSNAVYCVTGYSTMRAPLVTTISDGQNMVLTVGGSNETGWYVDFANTNPNTPFILLTFGSENPRTV